MQFVHGGMTGKARQASRKKKEKFAQPMRRGILPPVGSRCASSEDEGEISGRRVHPVRKLLFVALFFVTAAQVNAVILQVNLQGTAGTGLLFGNEPGVSSGGSGGETGAGITYDDVSNLLDVTNVGWGSSQGFTDLSSLANNSHIHGPTASNNGNGFTETTGVLFTLNRSSNAVTGGTFTNPLITLSAAQETDFLNGKYYINIHTQNNGGGEIRGFLVVPEPSSLGLVAVGALTLLRRRHRRIRTA